MKLILCITLLALVGVSMADTGIQEREGGQTKIPCYMCYGAIEFLKNAVGYEQKFNSEFVYSVLQTLCKYIGKVNDWAGTKCNEYMTKAVSNTIHGFLARHLTTATLCGYGGKLTQLLSGETAGIVLDCKGSRQHGSQKDMGLSDEQVVKKGIYEYMQNFESLVKKDQALNRNSWPEVLEGLKDKLTRELCEYLEGISKEAGAKCRELLDA